MNPHGEGLGPATRVSAVRPSWPSATIVPFTDWKEHRE